jgi:AraC-like DNA-binding protein
VRLEDLVRLRRARDLMDRDYAKPLDVPALARTAFLSPGHFSPSFRAAFGETPYSYLMTRRIERAKGLRRRGDDWSARARAPPGPAAHDEGAAIPACVAKIHTRPVRNGEANPAPRP